jgi:hypothetical protein
MKKLMKPLFVLIVIAFVSSIALINGCGSADDAKNAGCPSGSNFASATDRIIVPDLSDVDTYVYSADWVAFFGMPYVPEPRVSVVDADGTPRNKVCLVISTDGHWWTDATYTTELFGVGPLNVVTAATDDSGGVTLHWTTYSLPLSSAGTSTAAGTDYTYSSSDIGISSGAISNIISVGIKVKGCPQNSLCP